MFDAKRVLWTPFAAFVQKKHLFSYVVVLFFWFNDLNYDVTYVWFFVRDTGRGFSCCMDVAWLQLPSPGCEDMRKLKELKKGESCNALTKVWYLNLWISRPELQVHWGRMVTSFLLKFSRTRWKVQEKKQQRCWAYDSTKIDFLFDPDVFLGFQNWKWKAAPEPAQAECSKHFGSFVRKSRAVFAAGHSWDVFGLPMWISWLSKWPSISWQFGEQDESANCPFNILRLFWQNLIVGYGHCMEVNHCCMYLSWGTNIVSTTGSIQPVRHVFCYTHSEDGSWLHYTGRSESQGQMWLWHQLWRQWTLSIELYWTGLCGQVTSMSHLLRPKKVCTWSALHWSCGWSQRFFDLTWDVDSWFLENN